LPTEHTASAGFFARPLRFFWLGPKARPAGFKLLLFGHLGAGQKTVRFCHQIVTQFLAIRFPNRHQVAADAPQTRGKIAGNMDIETLFLPSLK
jgi:hypothetical protein